MSTPEASTGQPDRQPRKPRRLPPMDAGFLHLETRATPMHVAGLQVFQLPANAPAGFIKSVVQTLRGPQQLGQPWNLKLARVPLSRLAPAMVEADAIDMDYHVRHTSLPSPGGERELGELVSHLHSTTLDRSRPLWTCHVIEGLENDRFALYTKVHHALVDGIRAMQLLTGRLGTRPGKQNWSPPWAPIETTAKPAAKKRRPPPARLAARDWAAELVRATRPLVRRDAATEPVRVPFEAPDSILNGPVTGARRVATQRLDLKRINAVAKQTDASVNDVFLAVCSGALRRHLRDGQKLPGKSLIAGVPVSMRADNHNPDAGNAVGFLFATLGTERTGPLDRLQAIRQSTGASKSHLRDLSPQGRSAFSALTLAPAIGVLLSGQGARFKPPMNVLISNVPGPDHALYLGRARMEAMYPVSIPIQGMALNITCVSYDGQLTVGFTGSRDSLPHLQRIAVYAADALDELEAALKSDSRG